MCGDKIEIKEDKESKRERLGGECVCPRVYSICVRVTSCACCFLNTPAAGVQSSKLSAQPASRGKYIYTPDTKDSTDERLVGVVSAESSATSLHTVGATNLVLGTTLSPSLPISIEVQRKKKITK